jgi:hypothetical protein
MIFQGLFKVLELYFNGLDIFYNNVDTYFLEKISNIIRFNQNIENNLEEALEVIIPIFIDEFVWLGLYRAKVQNRFSDKFLTLRIEENGKISSIFDLYKKKIAPLIYEVILEQIIFYLVDDRGVPILLNFKYKGMITLGFLIELRNLKNLLEETPEKLEKLRRYIRIRDKIIIKLCENKEKIEHLEDLDDLQNKLQLLYLTYKIIDSFNIQYFFNFSHMKEFLKEHFEDCMEHIPLISLKNPDLCYCALYLANELKVNFNHKKIKNFLLDIYPDHLDEFEVPIIEATNQIYFYLKSTSLARLWLTDEQVKNLVKFEPEVLETHHLEDMETSQLANILAIFAFLEYLNNIDEKKIEAIYEEIEKRITPIGVTQNRNGFYSSEASYYVIFSHYINNNPEKLKSLTNGNLLDNIVSKIYRNLEFLEFSEDMNMDLLSELFYSVESLRLFNCIKLKENTLHLARYLFPKEIELKILDYPETSGSRMRSRYLMINRITGETDYFITS